MYIFVSFSFQASISAHYICDYGVSNSIFIFMKRKKIVIFSLSSLSIVSAHHDYGKRKTVYLKLFVLRASSFLHSPL